MQQSERREKRKQENRQNNVCEMQKLMIPENYSNELNNLRNDEQAANWIKQFVFFKKFKEYPFFMDIPITGEFVFLCDRRIWQSKLFNDYIYWRFNRDYCTFSIQNIQKRIFNGEIKDRYGQITIQYNQKRTYKTALCINGQEQIVFFSFDVIWRYIEYLELLGFVWNNGSDWQVDGPITLNPPNYLAANILKDILKTVDISAPQINQIIKNELLSKLDEKDKKIVLNWREPKI